MFKLLKKIFRSSSPVSSTAAVDIMPPADSGPSRIATRALDVSKRDAKTQGNVLLARGELGEAARLYLEAIAINPDDIEGHINLGYVFSQLKRHEEAIFHLNQAVRIDPSNADSTFMLGNLAYEQGKIEEAAKYFNDVLTLTQDYEIVFRVLLRLNRFEEAVASCDAILTNKLDYAGAHINRGIALQALDRHREALEAYSQALILDPSLATTWLNYGVALKNLKRYEEELVAYDKAIQLQPDLAEAHFNSGLSRLQLGEFERGWEQHEWRWKTPQLAKTRRQFAQPLWLGKQAISGKTILLHAEQGLGDTIQFSRYVKAVANKGANVLVLVQQSLKSVLTMLDGATMIISDGDKMPPFDFHCPFLTLPLACATTLDTIDSATPYIHVESRYVEKWRGKLGAPRKLRVGLVWSGNANHLNDRNRSIPLENFRALQSDRWHLISLQKEVRATDSTTLTDLDGITNFGNALEDFTDTAGLILNVDLVISVDTSVAHLAGALGKPCWILLPAISDWRWMHSRSDSPWYPSVTLFRQTKVGDWGDVIETVTSRLNAVQDGTYELNSALSAAINLVRP